jgi:hypothetical protein
MADKLDLTTKAIPDAINEAVLRGRQPAIAYVNDAGDPEISFRGSTYVFGPDQLAIWVRKQDSGLAVAIKARPHVGLVYYGGHEGPGPAFLSFKGSARVDTSADDAVYAAIVEPERQQDPERKGVAVIIDVDSVQGYAPPDGFFQMER